MWSHMHLRRRERSDSPVECGFSSVTWPIPPPGGSISVNGTTGPHLPELETWMPSSPQLVDSASAISVEPAVASPSLLFPLTLDCTVAPDTQKSLTGAFLSPLPPVQLTHRSLLFSVQFTSLLCTEVSTDVRELLTSLVHCRGQEQS